MLSHLQTWRSLLWAAGVRWAAVILLCTVCLAAPRPESALIDGHNWKIKWLLRIPLGTDFEGETECRIHTIFIEIQLNNPQQEKTTLQHEILHAFTCEDGEVQNWRYNSSTEAKHEGIYYAAPRLVEFMQRNPKVMKFLSELTAFPESR
jgi:hypothetical protein